MVRILSRESKLPMNLERVRTFLRIESEHENELLGSLILSAIEEVETYTGLLLTKCVCEITYEDVCQSSSGLVEKTLREVSIRLPHAPFLKMCKIEAGGRKILNYRLKVSSQDVALCGVMIPNQETLTLTYEAGFENAPEVLKLAVLEIVAFRYEHRGEGAISVPGIEAFLRPYRTLHLWEAPMLMIKLSDLKERIQFTKKVRQEDGQGGWIETLQDGEEVWAQVSPIVGRGGFHPDDLGGGMASSQGYMKRAQPARYRVTIRREIAIPQAAEVIWKIGIIKKRFLMSSQPYLILDKRFQCFLMVEMGDEA